MALMKLMPAQAKSIFIKKTGFMNPGRKKSASGAYGFYMSTWDLARLFGKRTTIHGVNRLLGETEGRYERAIWLLTVILAFAGSVYVCLIISHRFKEGRFQTVVDNRFLPIYKINFPVVTICNLNRLNWLRIDEAKRRFLPNETSIEKLKLFEEIVATYDDVGFGRFDVFSVLEGRPLQMLNHINFSLVYDFMTWRCDEFLEKCTWHHTKWNCCEIFSKRSTKNGLCWAFNSLETEEGRRMQRLDSKWPWRTGAAGPKSALTVRVLIHPDKHYPKRSNKKGLKVMITEPYVWHDEPVEIPANTEAVIRIESDMYFYDNEARRVPSEQRQCVFDDERNSANFKSLHNFVYMYENCLAECHQEYLMHYCNCSMDLLFPPGQFPPCKAKDLPCLARNNDHFLYTLDPGEEQFVRNEPEGMECKCFLNCFSLNYVKDAHSSFIPAEVRKNTSYVDLDVHYRFNTLMVYRTTLVFNWVDLMVAFGGIAGLFLGCSLISAMELVYFTCIEVPHFLFKRIRSRRRQYTQSQETNAVVTQRVAYKKFPHFMQRHMKNDNGQLEEFVLKNNSILTISESSRCVTLNPGRLKAWQNLTEKTTKSAKFLYD